MRIILLATDESPALAPLTDRISGPLVPIVNRPVIGIALEQLARAGCKHAFVSLYHQSSNIAAYLNSGRRWGMTLEYLTQREPLGSAGALRWASNMLNETFLVVPVDAILDLDIEAALAFHRLHGGPATVIAQRSDSGGALLQVAQQRVVALGAGKCAADTLCATGAAIFEPSVFDHIPSHLAYDTYSELLPALLQAQQQVHVFAVPGYWNPLQSFTDYEQAQRVFLFNAFHADHPERLDALHIPRLRYPSVEGRQIAPGIWVGINDVIHPTANFAAPVCISDNCWIGRDTEIGPSVVIGADAVIDEEATVERTTIQARTYVGRLLKLTGVIADRSTLIDVASTESTQIVDGFLLAEIGADTPDGGVRRFANLLAATVLLGIALPLLLLLGLATLVAHGRLVQPVTRVGSRPPTFRRRQENGPYSFTMFRLAVQRRTDEQEIQAFGRWLLRSGLAYIPALINVIRGDCELIGVKPLRLAEAARIQEDWQLKHYERPAGLGGAWYVQTNPGSDLDDVLIIDAYYVAMRKWSSDILLLWSMIFTWLQRQMPHERIANDQCMLSDVS